MFLSVKMFYQKKTGATLLLTTLIAAGACAPSSNDALRNKIEGKGKLSIDLVNPYLAPNQFLSKEAENSETLKGFLQLKGNPQHIAFYDTIFSGPKLELYYDDKNEKYKLEHIKKDWIINGPFSLVKKGDSKPEDESNSSNNSTGLFGTSTPPVIPTDKDTAASTTTAQEKVSPTSIPKNQNKKRPSVEVKFDDIFHLVRFQGESLEFLAQWYTNDLSNKDRIQSINSLTPGILKEGTTVRIPSYLIKTKDAPTEDDLRKFILKHQ